MVTMVKGSEEFSKETDGVHYNASSSGYVPLTLQTSSPSITVRYIYHPHCRHNLSLSINDMRRTVSFCLTYITTSLPYELSAHTIIDTNNT